MAAHRYWRVNSITVPGGGFLEIAEWHLYNGGTRVDASATLTASDAVTNGALANLQDNATGTRAAWAEATVEAVGFWIKWDFGTAQNVDGSKFCGFDTNNRYPSAFTLQYSDDNSSWTTQASASGIAYPGNLTFTDIITLGEPRVVAGVVKDSSGTPISGRKVRVYKRSDGTLVGEATSSAGSGGDADLASVSTLLHFNGADASTTFTDNGPAPKTYTANSGAVISTSQSKFGGASGLFTGGANISTPYSTDFEFGTGDWTIELWVRPTDFDDGRMLLSRRNNSSSAPFELYSASGNLAIRVRNAADDAYQASGGFGSGSAISSGSWQHVAVVCSGQVVKMFKDGVAAATTFTLTSAIGTSGNGLYIGTGWASGYPFNGYIDDLRITKGVARYTANFTPPAAPFPETEPSGVGAFSVSAGDYSDPVTVVVLGADAGSENALVFDRVIPLVP